MMTEARVRSAKARSTANTLRMSWFLCVSTRESTYSSNTSTTTKAE